MTPNYDPLWHWVREREAIRRRKEDEHAERPWTTDEILAAYRFCNVRREDDLVTRWVAEHIRKPFADHTYLWFMLCIARQINWPATLAELIATEAAWPLDDMFAPECMAHALEDRARRGDKVFTGAYIITAPSTKGVKKTEFVSVKTLGALWTNREKFATYLRAEEPERRSLRRVHSMLMRFDGWGPFLAYQAVVDMRFCRSLLASATDIAAWAAAGPGTIRGLNRLHGRPVDAALSQERALSEMRAIYAIAERETGVAMDFSDVPNILCETDKYLRVKNGEGKPRALYVPGRGA